MILDVHKKMEQDVPFKILNGTPRSTEKMQFFLGVVRIEHHFFGRTSLYIYISTQQEVLKRS